jgi:tetraacyldisaccharide 4'-kinase
MPYADHHAFRDEEIMFILEVAAKRGAAAVTTEKDFVRLSLDARRMVEALPVRVEFAAPAQVEAMLAKLFAR